MSASSRTKSFAFDRRRLLLGLTALTSFPGFRARRLRAASSCTLTPRATDGPYYINGALVRRDITEGRPGVRLNLALRVVSASTCLPIPGALVEIWHADAGGVYSGFAGQPGGVNTVGQVFLRGFQATDEDGVARFVTVYPGWYNGRVTHIHFKVHFSNQTSVTSQLFFPADVTASIYTTRAPYSTLR